MEVQPIHMYSFLTSNQDLQKKIDALEGQMKGLDKCSPEYLYDQLHLELEQEEQKIREANPNLDPLNSADAKKLGELLAESPNANRLNYEIKEMTNAFSSEDSNWGIPWYYTKAVLVE